MHAVEVVALFTAIVSSFVFGAIYGRAAEAKVVSSAKSVEEKVKKAL